MCIYGQVSPPPTHTHTEYTVMCLTCAFASFYNEIEIPKLSVGNRNISYKVKGIQKHILQG